MGNRNRIYGSLLFHFIFLRTNLRLYALLEYDNSILLRRGHLGQELDRTFLYRPVKMGGYAVLS